MGDEAARSRPVTPEGVFMKSTNPCVLNKRKCIICQKTRKNTKLTATGSGQKRVREAAEIRQDDVFKRLKQMSETETFCYHVDNECYKTYTLKKTLDTITEQSVKSLSFSPETIEQSHNNASSSSICVQPRRSCSTPRNPVSSQKDASELPCVVCGYVRISHGGVRVDRKFRVCEEQRANKFLAAANFFQDDIFGRIADLDSEQKIFAADLYAHGKCMNGYIVRYERESLKPEQPRERYSRQKLEVFQQAKDLLDPLLEDGYGFTLSEIRELMHNIDNNMVIHNNEIKIFLVRMYQDKIKFCQSPRQNEPLLVFSSKISSDDLASKIKSHDAVKSAGAILRQAIQKVDFKLQDKFCDASELRHSWENTIMPDVLLTFFSSLFNISKTRMLQIEMLQMGNETDDAYDVNEDTNNDASSGVKRQAVQLWCLFQIIFYELHNGSKKTPLHTMTAHSIYDKCKSRELITTMNRIGVSTSYIDVLRSRNLLSAYAIESCEDNDTPIPSHFNNTGFTIGALDNFDFEDSSSLSGTSGTHDTVMVLFQDCDGEVPLGKPNVSATQLKKRSCKLMSDLPCQRVGHHPKPANRPVIPDSFKVAEDVGLHPDSTASCEAAKTEFLITLARCGLPEEDTLQVAPWGGFHALISQKTVPLKRVAFLPVIPSPATDYATVFSAMKNFQNVCTQLRQPVIPIFCDEGVFHTVADIILNNPDEFGDIYPMMGMFHLAKVALRCAGRYISGSGMDDALIESEVFGEKTVQAVLNGSHYYRSFQGMLIVSEAIETLMWKAFWHNNNSDTFQEIISMISDLRAALQLNDEQKSQHLYQSLMDPMVCLRQSFCEFIEECCAKSELCKYWNVFLTIVGLVKSIVTSDREGNWELHVQTVESLISVFREFDCINYLRYGSWYLERIRILEVENPFLYDKFMHGHFVVRDKDGKFNAVSPDMKLGRTIQRSQKSSKGIVGQTRRSDYVGEWELIYHEVLAISNVFRELTKSNVMDHSESSHHELTGRKGQLFDSNVVRLLEFIQEKGNPFEITEHIQLHNFVTKQNVDELVKDRLLNVMQHGLEGYTQIRNERFIRKEKKLSDTITRVKLPSFRDSTKTITLPITPVIAAKQLTQAQKVMDIARARGESVKDILTHDLLPTCPLFEGDAATKPVKHTLISELEKHLTTEEYDFDPVCQSKTTVIIDFMSQIRMVKMSVQKDFGQAVSMVLRSSERMCNVQELHIVFDSYLDLSVKESERIRRSSKTGSIELVCIHPTVPIPVQMDKFWASSANKTKLQQLACNLARDESARANIPVIASGMVINDEIVPPVMYSNGDQTEVHELSSSIEEADLRIIPHVNWAVEHGAKRVVILSNDTDVVALLIRYAPFLEIKGLREFWIRFGTGARRRFIPLHKLLTKLGPEMCSVLVKSHIITGNDALSKIGTKHSALTAQPVNFLKQFAESDMLSDQDIGKAEKYLVRVWSRNTTVATFNELRYIEYRKSNKSLVALPPTSSSIRGHILRAFYLIRESLTLLDPDHTVLSLQDYGWDEVDSLLRPSKFLTLLPDELLTLCGCTMCSTKRCKCKLSGVKCTVFCKCDNQCQNV